MQRRDFLRAGSSAAIGATLGTAITTEDTEKERRRNLRSFSAPSVVNAVEPPFALDYAPHFGMFRNSAPGGFVAELEFMHDQGLRSLEDNDLRGRSAADQEQIGRTLARLGMRMGVFVVNPRTAWTTTFAEGKAEFKESFVADCEASVELAKRVNAKWATVVMGTIHPRIEPEYMTANAVEILRAGAEVLERGGLTMVLEPLNRRDHPNLLLTRIPQAYQICRAVDSPSCKILFDIYHQQITEGNLIPNFDAAWSEVGYVQVGDNPGRKEPGTGEINYAGVFAHLKRKGFTGVVGMEHGNSKPGVDGEKAVIASYRAVDPR